MDIVNFYFFGSIAVFPFWCLLYFMHQRKHNDEEYHQSESEDMHP